jgi:hypothetical protein
MTRRAKFNCGTLRINFCEQKTLCGHTFSGEETTAAASIYRVNIAEDEHLDIAYTVWSTGEKDVRALTVESADRALRRLEHGLRLGVDRHKGSLSVVELRQARIRDGDPNWSNCFKASISELCEGAGMDVVRMLRRAGAVDIGTKMDVLEDYGRHRDFMCATFRSNAQLPPVVAYVLTRVLPLMRCYTHEE